MLYGLMYDTLPFKLLLPIIQLKLYKSNFSGQFVPNIDRPKKANRENKEELIRENNINSTKVVNLNCESY